MSSVYTGDEVNAPLKTALNSCADNSSTEPNLGNDLVEELSSQNETVDCSINSVNTCGNISKENKNVCDNAENSVDKNLEISLCDDAENSVDKTLEISLCDDQFPVQTSTNLITCHEPEQEISSTSDDNGQLDVSNVESGNEEQIGSYCTEKLSEEELQESSGISVTHEEKLDNFNILHEGKVQDILVQKNCTKFENENNSERINFENIEQIQSGGTVSTQEDNAPDKCAEKSDDESCTLHYEKTTGEPDILSSLALVSSISELSVDDTNITQSGAPNTPYSSISSKYCNASTDHDLDHIKQLRTTDENLNKISEDYLNEHSNLSNTDISNDDDSSEKQAAADSDDGSKISEDKCKETCEANMNIKLNDNENPNTQQKSTSNFQINEYLQAINKEVSGIENDTTRPQDITTLSTLPLTNNFQQIRVEDTIGQLEENDERNEKGNVNFSDVTEKQVTVNVMIDSTISNEDPTESNALHSPMHSVEILPSENCEIISNNEQNTYATVSPSGTPFQKMVEEANNNTNNLTISNNEKKISHSLAESTREPLQDDSSQKSDLRIIVNNIEEDCSEKRQNVDKGLLKDKYTTDETYSEKTSLGNSELDNKVLQIEGTKQSKIQVLHDTIDDLHGAISSKDSEKIIKVISDDASQALIATSRNVEVLNEDRGLEKKSTISNVHILLNDATMAKNKENFITDLKTTLISQEKYSGYDSCINSKLENQPLMPPSDNTVCEGAEEQVSEGVKACSNFVGVNNTKGFILNNHSINEKNDKVSHPFSTNKGLPSQSDLVDKNHIEECLKHSNKNFHTDANPRNSPKKECLVEVDDREKQISTCTQTPARELSTTIVGENERNGSSNKETEKSECVTQNHKTSQTITENTEVSFQHSRIENSRVPSSCKPGENGSEEFDKQKEKCIINDHTTDFIPKETANEHKVSTEISSTENKAKIDQPTDGGNCKCCNNDVEETKTRKPGMRIKRESMADVSPKERNSPVDKNHIKDLEDSLHITPKKSSIDYKDIAITGKRNSTATDSAKESKSTFHTPDQKQDLHEHKHGLIQPPEIRRPTCDMQYIINFGGPIKPDQTLTVNQGTDVRKLSSSRISSSTSSSKNTPDSAKKSPASRVTTTVIPTIMSPITIFKRSLTGNIMASCGGRTCYNKAGAQSAYVETIPTISCPMCIAAFGSKYRPAEEANMELAPKCHSSSEHRNLNAPSTANAKRRLQFLPKTANTNNENSSVPEQATRHNGKNDGCQKPSSLMDWYPGYRFYIMKP